MTPVSTVIPRRTYFHTGRLNRKCDKRRRSGSTTLQGGHRVWRQLRQQRSLCYLQTNELQLLSKMDLGWHSSELQHPGSWDEVSGGRRWLLIRLFESRVCHDLFHLLIFVGFTMKSPQTRSHYRITLDDVKCSRAEWKSCSFTEDHDCDHSEDVFLSCSDQQGETSPNKIHEIN